MIGILVTGIPAQVIGTLGLIISVSMAALLMVFIFYWFIMKLAGWMHGSMPEKKEES